jgi:hypothetical protein
LKKIHAFVASGGKVIAVRRAPSMDAEGLPLGANLQLSKDLFNPDKSTLVATEEELGNALHTAAAPDFRLPDSAGPARDQLGFIRRKLAGADIYFVSNTSNHPIYTTAGFATKYKSGEQWDPDSATATPASAVAQPIHLAPYESRVFVFSAAPSNAKPILAAPATQLADLSNDWKVTFTSMGKSETEPTLTDWTADPATAHYSGEVVYARDFSIAASSTPVYLQVKGGEALPGAPDSPPEHPVLGTNGLPNPLITRPGPGMHAYFDPPIREAALVTINGHDAGALWHPPYRLDVTTFIKPGRNHIEIHVYNTALNAWSAQPPHDFKPLIAKYGDRFQMQDLDKVAPLSSGLLGQVVLLTEPSK